LTIFNDKKKRWPLGITVKTSGKNEKVACKIDEIYKWYYINKPLR